MSKENKEEASPYQYFPRDLSWLKFNYRILMEAADQSVPLYERLKFIAIYSSNLDEFFRVRVATWQRLVRIKKKIKAELGASPKKLLKKILQEVNQQQEQYGTILKKSIIPQLAQHNILLYPLAEAPTPHESEIKHYFLSRVLSYLQPVILTDSQRTLFLENGQLYFALELQKQGTLQYAVVNIPSNQLPRFLQLPDYEGKHYLIYLDDVIRMNLNYIFPGFEVLGCYAIKLNRDADLEIEDEFDGNLVEKIQKHLHKRQVGPPSRFLFDQNMPEALQDFLQQQFELSPDEMIVGGPYHNLNDFMKLPNPLAPALTEQSMPPLKHPQLKGSNGIFRSISERDQILHFPYQSYDYVLRFFNEAAIDPLVEEINVTLYRVAAESLIANALISAAMNGKQVTAFVEVKARFDEANNLKWAQKMEEAGVRLIYSLPGLKVHAKVALIKRKTDQGLDYFAYLGTGNFHEGTARIYGDHGLLTADKQLGRELEQVFDLLESPTDATSFEHLLVAQHNMQPKFLSLIQREIEQHQSGGQGHIIIKLNNIEDRVMIDKLYEASTAGVKIDLLVRGICCVIPDQIYSQNITITRLIDGYLEHARMFWFRNNGDDQMYLASADWMNRNLYRRIEVGFPILDTAIKSELYKFLQLQLQDNCKAYTLDAEHDHQAKETQEPAIRAQKECYDWLAAL